MEETNKYIDKPAFQEEESSFDIMEWIMLFVSHWYLFLFSLAIMLTFAYLQNRKWQPEYKSSGTVIIDESRSAMNSAQVLMQGFGIQESFRNVNNQVIMLSSYDLMARVVDSLPQFRTEYISRGGSEPITCTDGLPSVSPQIMLPPKHMAFFLKSISMQMILT